ncbi:hypothetical protein [Bdellovibrio sp. BCCA]|uniref:hypothetical protein n=1 Tax=Bdellovibrio sp. BCCA TaxID=3136281 RepID=UPI0030F07C10
MKNLILLILSMAVIACSKEEITLPSAGQFEGGTWYADCFSKDGAYQKRTAKFDGGSYSHSMTIYSDASCSVQQIETGETGTYVIGGPISEGSHSIKLDLTIGALTVKPLNTTVEEVTFLPWVQLTMIST